MENRTRLRVQNKKPIKRSGRKPLVKKFFDYLKSDTFMYAPLVSPQPSVLPSPNAFKGFKFKLNHYFLFLHCLFFLLYLMVCYDLSGGTEKTYKREALVWGVSQISWVYVWSVAWASIFTSRYFFFNQFSAIYQFVPEPCSRDLCQYLTIWK